MRLLPCLVFAAGALQLAADPLSKSLEIDFFREVPNRNLKGLVVRSDGRVLPGPKQMELPGRIPADLLWAMTPTTDAKAWLVGTGPEGKVFRVNTSVRGDFQTETAVDLDATHVFALLPLDERSFLAGTSPQGTLSLVRDGKVVASVTLPADSIFDIAPVDAKSTAVLVATGNPGRIYRVDLARFEKAGDVKAKAPADELAKAGITLFGEIRDRNVRRLLALADGRVVAGSAPKGNVYSFPAAGGAPLLLLENREAEVTDLTADGAKGFYAAITMSGTSGESRVARPTPAPVTATPAAPATEATEGDAAKAERFTGRGQLVYFPADGLPETVVSRTNTAFYRLAWHSDDSVRWLIISGGEQGELLAYAPAERRSLNLGASASAQVNLLLPSQPGVRGLFHLLRNNPAGLSQLNFYDDGARSLETRKLDLGVAAEIGQIRFAQLAGPVENLRIALRTSFGSDELEGWSDWVQLAPLDGGWFAPNLRGRYVQLRITHAESNLTPLSVDKATLFYLPQNRRPQLTDFRIFPANLALIPAGEQAPPNPTTTLGQMLFPNQREGKDDAKRKGGLLNSPIVPAPGSQIVYWTLADADDDNLSSTFSISPEGKEDWTELAVGIPETFVQFDVSHLPEGRYRTRLAVKEQAPRPEAQRLSYTFETDVLTVDRTQPEILGANVDHAAGAWRVSVEGRDALSLIEGAEFVLNNGSHVALEHPVDGILDSRHEKFTAEFTEAKAAGATSVEITLYDKSGNSSARRLPLK